MFSMNNSGIAAQQNLQTLQESENRNKKNDKERRVCVSHALVMLKMHHSMSKDRMDADARQHSGGVECKEECTRTCPVWWPHVYVRLSVSAN